MGRGQHTTTPAWVRMGNETPARVPGGLQQQCHTRRRRSRNFRQQQRRGEASVARGRRGRARRSGRESRAASPGRRVDMRTERNSRPGGSGLPTSAVRGTGSGRESENNRGEGDRESGEEAEVGLTRTTSGGGRGRRAESQRIGRRGAVMSSGGRRIPNYEAPQLEDPSGCR